MKYDELVNPRNLLLQAVQNGTIDIKTFLELDKLYDEMLLQKLAEDWKKVTTENHLYQYYLNTTKSNG
jgi:hypothetical protein